MINETQTAHNRATQRDAAVNAEALARLIAGREFHGCAVTIVGYGFMGREYLKALRALGVGRIRVCSRRPEPLEALRGEAGLDTVAGGASALRGPTAEEELAIVASPVASVVEVSQRLIERGFRRLLIEKPVSLFAEEIAQLGARLEAAGVEAACAYNRVAYPAVAELRARAVEEGGITSCLYGMTELVQKFDPTAMPAAEAQRWGIANSLHVVSLAHALIGQPGRWRAFRSGSLPWHPSGATFSGAGVSERGIPFAYHADWGSPGRWWVEASTRVAAYRLCPLETLTRRTDPLGAWEPVALRAFAPQVKVGLAEQVAGMLDERIRSAVPLVSLREAAGLAAFGEDVFGYR